MEARFYNPYPIEHDWDYGFVFTNPSDNSQYNALVDADSDQDNASCKYRRNILRSLR